MSIFQKIKSLYLPKKKIFHSNLVPKLLFGKMIFFVGVLACLVLVFPVKNFAQQTNQNNAIVYKKNVLHQHTGDSEGGGGCYSLEKTGTNTQKIYCDGTMNYWSAYDTTTCSRCGASYSGDQSHRDCWHYETKTTYYTYYELGCGKEEGTCVGSLTVVQSNTNWAKSLVLTASYENIGNMNVYDRPFIWNGTQAGTSNVYNVKGNGTYTLQLNADTSSDTQSAIITIDVRNVDVTAPVIRSHAIEPSSGWTREGVIVTLTEAVDLQPDGSAGSGLHETPYSYDGGRTWTAESSHRYTENGPHNIFVRDRLRNSSTYEVSFQNIDTTPPVIESVEYDRTKNIPAAEVVVKALDLQPDGSTGSGLHETPYSFDGGQSWTADNIYTVTQNGTLKIAVRDQLGNILYREEAIQNLDCTAPKISYTMSTDSWTNKNVSLHLAVSDINEDGTDGSGLADAWYSLDDGKTWSDEEVLVFEENTSFTITARDRSNNTSTTRIDIIQIDKEHPWVSLSMEILGDGPDKKVKLQALGGDDDSGLHEEGYSWDNGGTFSDQSSKIITENGIYKVYVRDKADNRSNAEIEVDVFPTLIPELPFFPQEEETTEVEPETETEAEPETETEIESETQGETETKTEYKTEPETKTKTEPKSETEPETEPEPETESKAEIAIKPKTQRKAELEAETEIESETESETEFETEVFAVTLEERIEKPQAVPVEVVEQDPLWEALLRFCGLMLMAAATVIPMFFIWSRTIAVYVKKANGRKQYMGRLWISHRDERYMVTIPDSLVEKAMTMCFCFCPTMFFVDSHKDEEMHFLFPEGVCMTLTIERNMEME